MANKRDKQKGVDEWIEICYSSNVVIVVSTATTAQNELRKYRISCHSGWRV